MEYIFEPCTFFWKNLTFNCQAKIQKYSYSLKICLRQMLGCLTSNDAPAVGCCVPSVLQCNKISIIKSWYFLSKTYSIVWLCNNVKATILSNIYVLFSTCTAEMILFSGGDNTNRLSVSLSVLFWIPKFLLCLCPVGCLS